MSNTTPRNCIWRTGCSNTRLCQELGFCRGRDANERARDLGIPPTSNLRSLCDQIRNIARCAEMPKGTRNRLHAIAHEIETEAGPAASPESRMRPQPASAGVVTADTKRCDGTNCLGHPENCYGHPHNCGCHSETAAPQCNGKCEGHSSEASLSGWRADPACPLHGSRAETTDHAANLAKAVEAYIVAAARISAGGVEAGEWDSASDTWRAVKTAAHEYRKHFPLKSTGEPR